MTHHYVIIMDGEYSNPIAIVTCDPTENYTEAERLICLAIKEEKCADSVKIIGKIPGENKTSIKAIISSDGDEWEEDVDIFSLVEYKTEEIDPVLWHETHYEIVAQIEYARDTNSRYQKDLEPIPYTGINNIQENEGSAGFYELAKVLTDEFEAAHKGIEWGETAGFEDWLDEVVKFFRNHPLVTGQ